MVVEYITKSPEETILLGKKMGKCLKKGDFIAFTGDLGAGKTTITRGIAENFGNSDNVTSPTFSIVNEYDGKIPIYHFDMYRINNESDIETTGFYDYQLSQSVYIVEWSENIKSCIPDNAIKIDISYIDENTRKIKIITSAGDNRFENSWN